MHRLSIQNAGMKMFGRNENKVDCVRFRISQEGVAKLIPYLSKQKVRVVGRSMMPCGKLNEFRDHQKQLVRWFKLDESKISSASMDRSKMVRKVENLFIAHPSS